MELAYQANLFKITVPSVQTWVTCTLGLLSITGKGEWECQMGLAYRANLFKLTNPSV